MLSSIVIYAQYKPKIKEQSGDVDATSPAEKIMTYFGLTDKPTYLIEQVFFPMAKFYWGAAPLPQGATLLGGYSDDHRAGALIELANGRCVCGNAGSISNIPQPKGA